MANSSQFIGSKGQTRCEAGAQSYGSAGRVLADRQTAEREIAGGFLFGGDVGRRSLD
jgi:hypothetical protein